MLVVVKVLDKDSYLFINRYMIRVKFIKNHKEFKEGETANLSPNEAFGLIDSGYAIVSKDMNEGDYVSAQVTSAFSKTTDAKNLPKYKRK